MDTETHDQLNKLQLQLHSYAFEKDERATPPESALAISYLSAFGYLGKSLNGWKDVNLGDIVNAIVKFQEFFGVPQTGQLSAQSIRAMEAQRCGFPDLSFDNSPEYMKIKVFADTNLPRWQKNGIVYGVQDYVNTLGKAQQDQIIDKAFAQWMTVCGIQLRRANPGEPADILISTGQGQRSNFDGPGGVLAWAYMPDGSDQPLLMRFDIDETWTVDPTQRGILMLNVACHEFGHLLGLDHSRVQGALMAPYYNAKIAAPQANDDIPRVVARYGPPTGLPPLPPLPPVPPVPPPPVPPTGKHTLIITGVDSVVLDGKQVA